MERLFAPAASSNSGRAEQLDMERVRSPESVTNVAGNATDSAEQPAAHAHSALEDRVWPEPHEVKERIYVSCFQYMLGALEDITPPHLTWVAGPRQSTYTCGRRESVEPQLTATIARHERAQPYDAAEPLNQQQGDAADISAAQPDDTIWNRTTETAADPRDAADHYISVLNSLNTGSDDRKHIYNTWRNDVRLWMQPSTLEKYEWCVEHGERQRAHELSRQAFSVYLSQLRGSQRGLRGLVVTSDNAHWNSPVPRNSATSSATE